MTETGENAPSAGLAWAEPGRSQSFSRDRQQYYLHFMTPRSAARCGDVAGEEQASVAHRFVLHTAETEWELARTTVPSATFSRRSP